MALIVTRQLIDSILCDAPDEGQYQTLLYNHRTSAFMLADDGKPALRISPHRVKSLRCDMYLFV